VISLDIAPIAGRTRRSGIFFLALAIMLGGCASDEERLAEFMERGEAYVEQGLSEEAIIEFKNVLQIDPNHAPAHEALSTAFLLVSKPREAYWEMSETVRLDPTNIDARLRYGSVSAVVGDHELAREQADAILELEPTRSQAFTLRAQALEAGEDYEGAEADLKLAVENEPEGPAYRFLYAGFLQRRQRSDEAEQMLRDLVEMEPSYLAYSSLARLVARGDENDAEAETLLRRTIEVAMEAPGEVVERDVERPGGTTSLIPNVLREDAIKGAHMLLSAFYYERGRFDDAVAILEDGTAHVDEEMDLIYGMARLWRSRGMDEKADGLLRRAAEVSPDKAAPQLVLSAHLGQKGDSDGALKAALRAAEIEPDNKIVQMRVAELRVDVGYRDGDEESIQAGRRLVDALLEQEPSSPDAHFVRAKIALAENDLTGAEQALLRVIEARPDWSQARFVLGSTLAAANELARARVELARAIEIEPTMRHARRLLTQIHSQLGEHEFAIEQGRAYLSQVPDDSQIRIVVGQSLIRVGRTEQAYEEVSRIPEEDRDAAAYFALGRLDLAFGRKEQARERLMKADEISPGRPAVLRLLLALDRDAGQAAASIKRIHEVAEQFPESSELMELQAEVLLLDGDLEAAEAALVKAVELNPANVSAQLARADLARQAGNVEQMIAVIESAAKAVPDSSDLQFRLAVLYEQHGERGDALVAYERAIALNDALGQAKNNLAYLLADTPGGDLDRALELAQQAKEQLPDDPNAADTLGWVLLKRGVPSAAIGYLQEAAERFPESAFEVQGIVRNHLAEAYEKNQEPAKAVTASEDAIGSFEKLAAVAKERGQEIEEPDWAREARARIQRIGSAG